MPIGLNTRERLVEMLRELGRTGDADELAGETAIISQAIMSGMP